MWGEGVTGLTVTRRLCENGEWSLKHIFGSSDLTTCPKWFKKGQKRFQTRCAVIALFESSMLLLASFCCTCLGLGNPAPNSALGQGSTPMQELPWPCCCPTCGTVCHQRSDPQQAVSHVSRGKSSAQHFHSPDLCVWGRAHSRATSMIAVC